MPKTGKKEDFIVYMILLTMPNGDTRMVQLAEKDFPPKANEIDALSHLIKQMEAQTGKILAFTEGYSPAGEIVTCL